MLVQINSADELGDDFGAGVYSPELDWVIKHEWVLSAEDLYGAERGWLTLEHQIAAIDEYVKRHDVKLMACFRQPSRGKFSDVYS